MSKHGERLKINNPKERGRAVELYKMALAQYPELRSQVKTFRFGHGVPAQVLLVSDGDIVYWLPTDRIIHICLASTDNDELKAGQVGPMGNM